MTIALNLFKDPVLDIDYQQLNAIQLSSDNTFNHTVNINLGYNAASLENKIIMSVRSQLDRAGCFDADINLQTEVITCPRRNQQKNLAGVKNIIAVSSAKGGVGKSTTAVNLALALWAEGSRVGLLDADIYGPSISTMLGVSQDIKPELVDDQFVKPISRLGIKSMSVAYMNREKTPVVWRGPMAVRLLKQFLEQTLWGELDYLIIDMPPGTGDIQISLAQQVMVSSAVIVTTPQNVALEDTRKGIDTFNKTGIPILGIVENMAVHECTKCGHKEHIFGSGGASDLAQEYQLPLLASLPLDSRIRAHADSGLPTVAENPTSNLTGEYINLAHQVSAAQWHQNSQTQQRPSISLVDA